MKGLPWRLVLIINGVLALGIFACVMATNSGNSAVQTLGFAMAIILPLTNLALGLLSLILMAILQYVDPPSGKVADRFMQTFMIGFGVALFITVPSCFVTLGVFP